MCSPTSCCIPPNLLAPALPGVGDPAPTGPWITVPTAVRSAATRAPSADIDKALDDISLLDDLRQAAEQLLKANPDLVLDRLRYIRGHSGHLEHVAQQSYWHANGFAKVRVIRGRTSCLRLHVWIPGENRVGDVDPHGHRWEFASWIAAGEGVAENYFRVADDVEGTGTEYTHYSYERGPGGVELDDRGMARLQHVARRTHKAGEVYDCSLRTLHTVAPLGSGLVATVVLQGPVVTDRTSVFRRDGRPRADLERKMSAQELGRLFEQVEEKIAACRPG